MTTEKDKLVQELFKVVQTKKAEISKAEKPTWLTNCSFGYEKGTSNKTNIRTVTDIEELVTILAFVVGKEKDFSTAKELLNVTVPFNWGGFTKEEWVTDLQTRINQIQISQKKKELESLETRLNGLVSKEMRDQMELEEITKLLGK